MTSRNTAIDGLRGIAALLVVVFHGFGFFHGWPHLLSPGDLGVRLFFVLSGALITYVLYVDRITSGDGFWTLWARFAYRRALRILPLAYLAILISWLAGDDAMRDQPYWYLTYSQNIGHSFAASWPHGLGHFWTLAVEEQMYLLWPALVLSVPVTRWPVLGWSLVAVAIGTRIAFWNHAATQLPFFFFDVFSAGGFVGWAKATGSRSSLAWLWLGVPIGLATFPFPLNAMLFNVQSAAWAMATAALVNWAWNRPRLTWLSARPLVWVGSISYGLYVWHFLTPRLLTLFGIYQSPYPPYAFLWQLGWGLACAAVTWYAFERPILRLKDRIGVARTIARDSDVSVQLSEERATFQTVRFP